MARAPESGRSRRELPASRTKGSGRSRETRPTRCRSRCLAASRHRSGPQAARPEDGREHPATRRVRPPAQQASSAV
eukprot:1333048-Prymnesium_polylepis.1